MIKDSGCQLNLQAWEYWGKKFKIKVSEWSQIYDNFPHDNIMQPTVSALIPRPAFNGIERMGQRHGSNQNSQPPVLVRKPLCNQFIHCHIRSRRVFGINRFKLCKFAVVAIECSFATVYRGSVICNFAVVAIECSFATVYRGSVMARIHRWSVMIYGSLQSEFMETKYNSHIHGYGTSVFGKIVVNISKSINNNNQIFRRL